jgi:hypothetical protein
MHVKAMKNSMSNRSFKLTFTKELATCSSSIHATKLLYYEIIHLFNDNIESLELLHFSKYYRLCVLGIPPSCISPKGVCNFVNNKYKQIIAKIQFWKPMMIWTRFTQQGLFNGQ